MDLIKKHQEKNQRQKGPELITEEKAGGKKVRVKYHAPRAKQKEVRGPETDLLEKAVYSKPDPKEQAVIETLLNGRAGVMMKPVKKNHLLKKTAGAERHGTSLRAREGRLLKKTVGPDLRVISLQAKEGRLLKEKIGPDLCVISQLAKEK